MKQPKSLNALLLGGPMDGFPVTLPSSMTILDVPVKHFNFPESPEPEDSIRETSVRYRRTNEARDGVTIFKFEVAEADVDVVNFSEPRLANIAVMFDAFIREGKGVIPSMIHAIDTEISLRENPVKPRALPQPKRESSAFGLERLPQNEESAILALALAAGVPVSILACRMTRQTGEGQMNRRPDLEWENHDGQIIIVGVRPRKIRISYDLMLCEYCGNLEPSDRCPAKLRALHAELLRRADATGSDQLLTP